MFCPYVHPLIHNCTISIATLSELVKPKLFPAGIRAADIYGICGNKRKRNVVLAAFRFLWLCRAFYTDNN